MITWNQELYHSWGKSPKQKAREKEYNHWYYLRNKEKWLKKKIKKASPIEVDHEHAEYMGIKKNEWSIRDKKKNFESQYSKTTHPTGRSDMRFYIEDTKGKGKGNIAGVYRTKHSGRDDINFVAASGKAKDYGDAKWVGPVSISKSKDAFGVNVGVDVKKTKKIAKKYSNKVKKNAKKIKKTASEHIANGKKKYEKFVNSNPPKNVDSETRKKVNRVAKSYSKSSRISEAKKYRTTKQIQKESGYSPKKLKTKQGRYSMDRENESRINTNKPGKINVYSSTDNWDERLKKKKR